MKKFDIAGTYYQFSPVKFSNRLIIIAKKHGEIGAYEEEIASKIGCGKSTVHNWRFGPSGPGSIDDIKKLAEILEMENYLDLMEVTKIMNTMNDLQIISAKRIYDVIIEFLDEFNNTNGFTTTLWYKFEDKGEVDVEEKIYEYIEEKMLTIQTILNKEYFYLHSNQLYAEFVNYVAEDLVNIYNGKLGYAYRVEAIPEGNPSTEEDYYSALNKLNSIIEKYI